MDKSTPGAAVKAKPVPKSYLYDGTETSPYWDSANVEDSKKIIETLSALPEKERDNICKELLKAHQAKWGKPTEKKPKNGKKPKDMRMRRYRIYPTGDQERVLITMEQDTRLVYNCTVAMLNGTSDPVNQTMKYRLRDDFTVKKGNTTASRELRFAMTRTPQEMRAKACFEAIAAHNLSVRNRVTLNPKYRDQEKAIKFEERKLRGLEKKIATKKKGKNKLTKQGTDLVNIIQMLKQDLQKISKFITKNKSSVLNPEYKSNERTTKSQQTKLDKLIDKFAEVDKIEAEFEKGKDVLTDAIEKLKEKLEFIPKFVEKESNLKMRTKKSPYSNITVPSNCAELDKNDKTKLWIYKTYFNNKPFKVKGMKQTPKSNFMIRHHRKTNYWYLLVPEEIAIKPKSKTHRTIVIDPGLRTFLTCVDFHTRKMEDPKIGKDNIQELGDKWFDERFQKRFDRIQRFQNISLKGITDPKKLRRLTKLKQRVELDRRKIHNMVDDLHKQKGSQVLKHNDIIVLPKLRTKSLVRIEGNLSKFNKKKASMLASCRFHNYLTWKAMTLGKIVIDQDEAFTTKTCYGCGKMTDIGPLKDFACKNKNCGYKNDRDVQSTYNITTRYMSSYSAGRKLALMGKTIKAD